MDMVSCFVQVNGPEDPSDCVLVANALGLLDMNGQATLNCNQIAMEVTPDVWSALCVMEDLGLLTCEQT